ncbi:hypothetical protein [Metabacillus idriensis]|uniref:hypothetical protein n=1 Tax=Metabacillus idriensis TaxID=324768 RepID=UPI003D2D4C2D
MSRKWERRLVLIGAIWQIFTGIITILFYASAIKKKGLIVSETSFAKMEAIQSVFGSMYMFAVSFGLLFVMLGIIHLYMMSKLEDDQLETKMPIWFMLVGLLSYVLMDIPGAVLFLSAGILALSKNKSIRRFMLENGS